MTKFLLKVVWLILPILILFIVFEVLLRNIPNDYSYKKSFLDKKSNQIEHLFFGSSHTYYGINPSYIDGFSFNVSHISQSIDLDYDILKKYEQRLTSLKTVVLPLDYFTLFTQLKTGKEAWRLKNYQIYYNIFQSFSYSNSSELLSFTLRKNTERLLEYYKNEGSLLLCDSLGFGNFNVEQLNLMESGKSSANSHTKDDKHYYKQNIEIYKSIISIAINRNARVIVYTAPAFKSYTDNLDVEQLQLSTKFIDELIAKYPNIEYYNFLNDDSFIASDYRDGDHLSTQGAAKLSKKMNEIVQKDLNKKVDYLSTFLLFISYTFFPPYAAPAMSSHDRPPSIGTHGGGKQLGLPVPPPPGPPGG